MPVHHELVRPGAVLDAEGRVLGLELVQRLADLLLVGAALGHARPGRPSASGDRAASHCGGVLAGVARRTGPSRCLDLGERDDLARARRSRSARASCRRAGTGRRASRPCRRSRAPTRSCGAERAAQDAREADLADVRVGLDVEHDRGERARRVGRDRRALLVGLHVESRGAGRVVARGRSSTCSTPRPVSRVAGEDRDQRALGDRVRQVRVQLGVVEVSCVSRYCVEQRLVLAGVHDPVHQVLAPRALRVLRRRGTTREKPRPLRSGTSTGTQASTDGLAQLLDGVVEVGVLAVEVRHDDARGPCRALAAASIFLRRL